MATRAREWMTPKEVATELEVTSRGVLKWIQQKKLRCTKVGGRYRITRADVTEFLTGRE